MKKNSRRAPVINSRFVLCICYVTVFCSLLTEKPCNPHRIYRKITEEVTWTKNVYTCIHVPEYLRLMISSYALNKIRHQFFFSNSINYLVRFLIALFATFEDSYMYTYSFSHAETLLYILVCTDSLSLG